MKWVGFVDWTKPGLLLSGDVGTGKTFVGTACAISMLNPEHMRTVAREDYQYSLYNKGRRFVYNDPCIIWQPVGLLMLRIRATYEQGKRGETEYSIIKELIKASILLLDDLGTQKESSWTAGVLYDIIAARRNENKYTIITTNHEINRIREWESRIADRIEEFHSIKLPNKNWRKK